MEQLSSASPFFQGCSKTSSGIITEWLIEISPQPTLRHYIKKAAEQGSHSSQSRKVVYVATHPHKSVKAQHKAFLRNTVGRLYTLGYSIDWDLVQGEQTQCPLHSHTNISVAKERLLVHAGRATQTRASPILQSRISH